MTRRELFQGIAFAAGAARAQTAALPWHRRTYRWGQTNITALRHRAEFLNGRDLNGELAAAAGCWTATSTGSPGVWRAPIDEYFPGGPSDVRIKLPGGVQAQSVQLRVSGQSAKLRIDRGWAEFRVASVLDRELAVLE